MHCYIHGLGWSPFARHYLGNHCLFSFPPGTKMFQFPGLALCVCRVTVLQTAGLSHSEIHGSKVICTYPRLIAAYHVLHRLREPRHPPDALTCFRHKIEYVASASTLPAANYSLFAHTFSCKLRVVKKHSVNKLEVFTYSLVCQYVKDLSPVSNYR